MKPRWVLYGAAPVVLACTLMGTSGLLKVSFVDKAADLLFCRNKGGVRVRESILEIPDRDCRL